MADLTPEMLDKLEAIAKAATPGPWSNDKPPKDEDGWELGVTIGATRGGMIFACPPSGQMPAADAKHIAASSPDVVLALVSAARKLERITSSMEEMAVDFDRLGLIGGDLTATEIRRRIKEVLNGGT